MPQIKISLDRQNIDFVSNHKAYGYVSKSAMIDDAVANLKKNLELQILIESAELYQDIYNNDPDLQELTNDAAGLCLE
jgi:hypothetical protein